MVALETVEGAPVVHDYTFPRRCALLLVGRLLLISFACEPPACVSRPHSFAFLALEHALPAADVLARDGACSEPPLDVSVTLGSWRHSVVVLCLHQYGRQWA